MFINIHRQMLSFNICFEVDKIDEKQNIFLYFIGSFCVFQLENQKGSVNVSIDPTKTAAATGARHQKRRKKYYLKKSRGKMST